MSKFILRDNIYLSQRDNEIKPNVSCFPTSMGMGIAYCLQTLGLDKRALGCSSSVQLEDFLNNVISDTMTKTWMRKNTRRLGKWIWSYKRRTIYKVEEYAFNRLMNDYGFKCKFQSRYSFDQYCKSLKNNELPIILGGNFKSVSRVGAHLVCGIGYDNNEFIVNDPFGNALKKYKKGSNGKNVIYSQRFFKRKNRKIFAMVIERL